MRMWNIMNGAAIATVALSFGVAGAALAQAGQVQAAAQHFTPGEPPPASGVPITAPVTVDTGQVVDVMVEGASPGNRIEIWGPIGAEGAGTLVSKAPLTAGAAKVMAPRMPGSYRLRYVGANGKVLGWRAFEVAAVPIALTVQIPVGAGASLQVTWRGPARPGDQFEIVSQSGMTVSSTPIVGDAAGENVSLLDAPGEPGKYQLRYVTAGGAVLRGVPFTVR